MARNLKALTLEQLAYIYYNYKFDLRDDYIYVKVKSYNRITAHQLGKRFSLSTEMRKITITEDTIERWISKYKDEFTLIEVQNAVNTLIVTLQDVTDSGIEWVMKTTRAKLDLLKDQYE